MRKQGSMCILHLGEEAGSVTVLNISKKYEMLSNSVRGRGEEPGEKSSSDG